MMTKQLSKDENINGWINGFIGVVLFSGGLPATKLAVMEMSPTFVTIVRAAVAGVLALIVLWLGKEKRPVKEQLVPLLLVSLGCVIGFPLLSAMLRRAVQVLP